LASRRSPDIIALEILNCIDEKGKASKWDIVKILGNEAQFKKWIDDFFLMEGILVETKKGRNYSYVKTERGNLLHQFLKQGNIIKIFSRLSGKRLRR
jgi:predicted transcriptional regulator